MADTTNGARPPRALGEDRVEEAIGEEILLSCPLSKGWDARTARTTVRSAHPGTAVAWEERIFEVRAAEPRPDGGMRYRLAPWEEGQAIRRFERYDAEAESGRETGRRDLASGIRKRRWSILLAPLAGLLPGSVQKAMEHEFGAPALGMTISSALPTFAIGFLGLFRHLLGLAGGSVDWPVWLAPPFVIALYLFGESALRLASAIASGRAHGVAPDRRRPRGVARGERRESRGKARTRFGRRRGGSRAGAHRPLSSCSSRSSRSCLPPASASSRPDSGSTRSAGAGSPPGCSSSWARSRP